MKKTYLNPELQVIKIQTQQMLANSLRLGEDPTRADDSDARGFDFEDED